MRIYTKTLLITLPLVLLALFAGAGISYFLARDALTRMADDWLATRLTEAVRTVSENEEFLRRYSITNIASGVKKAQYDAAQGLRELPVGELGFAFVVDGDGRIVVHPDQEAIGSSVRDRPWFAALSARPEGRLDYAWGRTPHLAMYRHFPPWDWYVVVTAPYREVYGSITKTGVTVLLLAVSGSLLLALLMVFLSRWLTAPLPLLVAGARSIGAGELETRIPVTTGDELGDLSAAFNEMAGRLQQSHGELQASRERLQALTSELLTTQEGERKRLSTELHDVVGQNLLFLKLKLTQLENGLLPDQDRQRALCEESYRAIQQLLENIRRLCWDLTPSTLEDLGLSAAIAWLVEDFSRHYPIRTEQHLERLDDCFSLEQQLVIYRIFQEALTNIGKHAGAGRVKIEARREDNRATFLIEDDGVGFDQGRTMKRGPREGGLGLSTMQERARILGARLQIGSRPGGGTTIRFTIPLAEGEQP